MLKIERTEKYSIAEELKIKAGDTLLQINDHDITDVLDYIFFDSQEQLDITIKKANGKTVTFQIEKDGEEPFGLVFGEEGEIDSDPCCNKCLFCFVDQLPRGMRKTLYFKDDDYRLSFVSGNYVTLTNIGRCEIDRIVRQKISPLYISVHATDIALRRKMLGNESADDIVKILQELSLAGIQTHCQVVLCEGLNDGRALQNTVEQLFQMYPKVNSLAVVPVGLTKHREGLYPLAPLTEKCAQDTIDFCEQFNKDKKTNFVFCSDEMYQIAQRDVPPFEYYGEFLQIENGVGLLKKFENEFLEAMEVKAKNPPAQNIVLVTGVSAAKFLTKLAERFEKAYPQIKINILPVKNNFFGHSVTVAGLVTGGDILQAVKDLPANTSKIIVPKSMLKEFSTLFLDNVDFGEIEKKTGIKTEVCAVDGGALVQKLLDL